MKKGLKGFLIVTSIIVAIIAACTVYMDQISFDMAINGAVQALNHGLYYLGEDRDYNAAMRYRDQAAYKIRDLQSQKLTVGQQREVQNKLIPMLQDLDNRLGL
jgi:hypothetical protein